MRFFTLFLTVFVLTTAPALGQRLSDQGNFFIGTSVGFSASQSNLDLSTNGESQTTEGPTTVSLGLEPNVGYFVTNRFGLGFSVDFSLQTVDLAGDQALDSDILIGPMARYYIPAGESSSFFFHLQTGFGTTADNLVIDDEVLDAQTTILKGGIGPGFTIFSTSNIGLEVIALYNIIQSTSEAESGGETISAESLTNQFDLQLGVQFYLDR